MLAAVGYHSLESLVDACVPEGVRDRTPLDLPAAADEAAVLAPAARARRRPTTSTPR